MPVDILTAEGHQLMGLFYNPNIHPWQENQRRLDCLRDWAGQCGLKLVVHDDYDPEAWFQRVAYREAMRCGLCHHDRMTRAAQVARRGGFDGFTSTLLYSVRQKHESVAEAGRAAAARYGVEFIYRDFRPYWKQGWPARWSWAFTASSIAGASIPSATATWAPTAGAGPGAKPKPRTTPAQSNGQFG